MARARRFTCSTAAFSESICFLQITPEECMSLATAASGLPGTVLGEGARPVIIAGVKYMVLRADENVFYVRQVGLSVAPPAFRKPLSSVSVSGESPSAG